MASKFLRVKCDCGTERVVFSNSATEIKCEKCNAILVHPVGGRAVVNGDILEKFD